MPQHDSGLFDGFPGGGQIGRAAVVDNENRMGGFLPQLMNQVGKMGIRLTNGDYDDHKAASFKFRRASVHKKDALADIIHDFSRKA